ncbi:hypothetical protein SAMN04489798_2309 [Pseudomonas arsenicoxydans]|uniref:Uncharacterized protein n=1 Tax=Pseudomonas arsenicoxydans TaxID=702115 RepID=A0A1H0HM90_9PSED|nr:hypothetical protein [Pseudomonas arsenicoxydans]SDO20217.1 hypothetical protein SAMN04489798_2309 [Pseudomonas arsenicoxydans]
MKIDFDADEDSASQARVLVDALTTWLAEQPAQAPRPARVEFVYRADNSLDSVILGPLLRSVK